MERPILFSTPLVRALLEGRKTETRRVITPQPAMPYTAFNHLDILGQAVFSDGSVMRCPYGQPGDLLYVRETWRAVERREDGADGVLFAADGAFRVIDNTPEAVEAWVAAYANGAHAANWRPSIFMPKWAARIWLRVEEVRVERVQDITDAGAMAEGCTGHPLDGHSGYPPGYAPRDEFRDLWDSINGSRGFGWDTNPWVWVLRFEAASTTGRPA